MKNIGFIGCGKIAPFHAEVLIHLGKRIKAVSNRSISERVKEFQLEYNVESIYTDWKEMIENEELDAIWLMTSWDSIENIVIELIKYKIPLFVEKPIALSSEGVNKIIEEKQKYGTKLQIGHNRRFYNFIPKLKSKLKDSDVLRSVQVEIPETTKNKDKKNKDFLWVHNSSHVVDLLTYLLGELKVIDICKSKYDDESFNTFNGLLKTKEEVPVHLISNWNAPANFGIKFYTNNKIIELKPIEFYSIYEGFDIQEPTLETPVRQYNPRLVHKEYCNKSEDEFKPGFLEQAKYFFKEDAEGSNKFEPTSLEEALCTSKLIEEILA
ncbi:Gfo/Idh/MocA family oxidoreductase [Aestuariibaculum sp. M13]|uniref:Gfo/Idh/MocA family protein n=1 Tax=Aestuariibaculum sp. M13 TaxID=2967132 RepID=UPI002159EEA6|nr:Gfo/Idh/MocA family oxidoreductase [Aestuariibaculum sp. M13]MCR8667206.1 Gfo/Idh/MocA family oxidoreductase [Aestuariibaculum sp. M13]